MPLKHPYVAPRPKPAYYRLCTPGTVGSLTAAVVAGLPHLQAAGLKALPDLSGYLPEKWEGAVGAIPTRVYLMLLGFALGFSVTKGLRWARMKALRALFSYQGWVNGGASTKTKVWALLLNLLKGPRPYSTYEFQRLLPRQPLPTLENTLDTWLNVSSQLLSEDEFMQTQQAVQAFLKNEGPRLQAHLQERAEREVSWLYEYWMTAAYLINRDPLAINSNFFNGLHLPKKRTTNQIARAATVVHTMARFSEWLDDETLPPVELMNLVPLCMNGYRFLFNTARIPGENIDSLARFPGKKHIVVIKDGQYFVVELYAPQREGEPRTLLNVKELKEQLLSIVKQTKDSNDRCNVAALTTQNRTQWAKHRELLQKNNADVLSTVESCMFVLCLDDISYEDLSEQCKKLTTGDGTDRWFDKCINTAIMGNAWGGHNVEHSAIDAMVLVSLAEYQCVYEKYDSDGDIACDPDTPIRALAQPARLQWNMEGMTDIVAKALSDYQKEVNNFELHLVHCPYGKGFMKKQRLSPDGFVQMAIQLAYYRKHKRFVKTYEPSTHRLFALGRTETVHPGSPYCTAFVKSMDDPQVSAHTCRTLLKQAVEHQTNFRLQATVGQGCDRHLLGLYLASRELGMDVPAIFADKAWQSPYTCSTSQTPINVAAYGCDVDIHGISGGFAAVCHEGYGFSYAMHGEDLCSLAISSYVDAEDTSSVVMAQYIVQAFEDMKSMATKST